jgi:hypothetical protein
MKKVALSILLLLFAVQSADAGLFFRRARRSCASCVQAPQKAAKVPSGCYYLPNGQRVCPLRGR